MLVRHCHDANLARTDCVQERIRESIEQVAAQVAIDRRIGRRLLADAFDRRTALPERVAETAS